MQSDRKPNIAWAIVACTLIVATAAVVIAVRLTPTKRTRIVERVMPTTTVAPTTTRPAPIDRITSGAPNGPVVWTTGNSRDDSSAYDCCYPSGPNGLAFAGTATCSGTINPVTGQGTVGGFFLDGKRC